MSGFARFHRAPWYWYPPSSTNKAQQSQSRVSGPSGIQDSTIVGGNRAWPFGGNERVLHFSSSRKQQQGADRSAAEQGQGTQSTGAT
ncbi:hypothetical protein SORBI_3004G161850 [Sorghum bicolor]|uniref:Uncharacterized protein n=1 Tax=Sorghum bicolor TaxID=4558 RepID=A0A1Z5RN90_SORBI|nr:hypothetical protein SORBI_3004G161850 [Sorghum bicolor]